MTSGSTTPSIVEQDTVTAPMAVRSGGVPDQDMLRVLLCIAATQNFYDGTDDERAAVKRGLREAFWQLGERFDVRVFGGIDDDLLSHGASHLPHYRAYILLDARNLETVVMLCRLVRETTVGNHRLWRYIGIDAHVGRPLPFVET